MFISIFMFSDWIKNSNKLNKSNDFKERGPVRNKIVIIIIIIIIITTHNKSFQLYGCTVLYQNGGKKLTVKVPNFSR